MKPVLKREMRSTRSSVLVGASRYTVHSSFMSISALYSLDSSGGRSSTRAPSTPLSAASATNCSIPMW